MLSPTVLIRVSEMSVSRVWRHLNAVANAPGTVSSGDVPRPRLSRDCAVRAQVWHLGLEYTNGQMKMTNGFNFEVQHCHAWARRGAVSESRPRNIATEYSTGSVSDRIQVSYQSDFESRLLFGFTRSVSRV